MSFNLDGFSPAVPVVLTKEISKHQLLNFPAFNTWITTLKSSLARQTEPDHPFHNDPYTLRSITIQSVDYFSPTRIGFIKLSAVVRNGKNETLPGIVFLRGGSVAILMILRPSDSKTERWVIMAEQPRIPVGSLAFMEIPAGMLDNEGTFVGAAAKQIAEETGLEIKTRDLKDLTGLALKKAGALDDIQPATYPSPGGTDEFIAIFLWEKVLDRLDIEDMKERLSGLKTQGEKIILRILDYEKLWLVGARDAKTLVAWSLYEALKRARHPDLADTNTW